MTTATKPDVHTFEHHWQDEADAAFLYRALASVEPDLKKRDVYSRLAAVEDRHVEIWAGLLTDLGHAPRPFRPDGPGSTPGLARPSLWPRAFFFRTCCARKAAK
jgi:hypothetical protein